MGSWISSGAWNVKLFQNSTFCYESIQNLLEHPLQSKWGMVTQIQFTFPGVVPLLNNSNPVGSLVRNLKEMAPPKLLFQAGNT